MAESDRHSQDHGELDPGGYSEAIREAFEELRNSPRVGDVKLKHWNDHYVALTTTLEVDRPPRSKIDIRQREPIIFLLHVDQYPYSAPRVRADRKDFPSHLPHLNPVSAGQPQSLCLHRGNLDDWFQNRTMSDLVTRVRSWLRDASAGRLIPEGDRFEATRLDGLLGLNIFPYEKLAGLAEPSDGGWSPILYSLCSESSTDSGGWLYAIQYKFDFLQGQLESLFDICLRFLGLSDTSAVDKHLIGLLLWPDLDHVSGEYFGVVPSTYGELKDFARTLGINVEAVANEYFGRVRSVLRGFPISLVVRRPIALIGKDTNIEILNFVVMLNEGDFGLHDNCPISMLAHREPLTPERAKFLSRHESEPNLPKTLIVGLGALGSKVALSLGRSGDLDLTLADYDELSPHNLVRHAMLRPGLGKNKAEATKEAIKDIYGDNLKEDKVTSVSKSLYSLITTDAEVLSGHDLILDFTASNAALNALAGAALPEGCRVIRGEIADEGSLGITMIEGPDRSPRVDDIQAFLFSKSLSDRSVAGWLSRYKVQRESNVGNALEDVDIGVSCSSDTLRLADDVISLYAAATTLSVRARPEAGELNLYTWHGEGDAPLQSRRWVLPPTVVCRPEESPGWEVRIGGATAQKLREAFTRSGNSETGGVLLGRFHFKKRIVFVTEATGPPKDSIRRSHVFVRGVRNLPEEIQQAFDASGGLITYVGEWHTHPRGSGRLSPVDWEAVHQLRGLLDPEKHPTHILIVTPSGFTPHLFIPE